MTIPQPAPKAFFIDENVTIHKGAAALDLIKNRAKDPIDPIQGVTSVDSKRWEAAQLYERHTWLEKSRDLDNDRNDYHQERFAGYSVLRGKTFKRGIELGCGPFTNMRFILKHCSILDVFLLDPLIDSYLTHPFCRYRGGALNGALGVAISLGWAAPLHPRMWLRLVRNAFETGGWLGRPVISVPSMIETFHTDLRFDLVIMINVLEHCQNAHGVFSKILELLEPGGTLIYHDRMYSAQEVLKLAQITYDAGHPLRVDQSLVDSFLAQNFESCMRAEYFGEREFCGVHFKEAEVYFVGIKKRSHS